MSVDALRPELPVGLPIVERLAVRTLERVLEEIDGGTLESKCRAMADGMRQALASTCGW